MAGRPKNPDWTTITFAPDANYPAGSVAWAGTPTKTAWAGAASNGFVPKSGTPAQAINFYFNHFADRETKEKDVLDKLVTYVGQLPALNVLTDQGSVGTPEYGIWKADEGKWVFFGTGGDDRLSFDNGRNWDTGNLSIAGTEDCKCADVNPDGDLAVSTDTRYVLKQVGGVSSKVDVFAVAITSAEGSAIAYDDVSGLWCCMLGKNDTGKENLVRTSPDLTTWTSRTGPTGWSYGPRRMLTKKTGSSNVGRMVAVHLKTSADEARFAYSDDGGITWTSGTFASDFVGYDRISLAYNEVTNEWFCTFGLADAEDSAGELWKSTDDGANWSEVKVFADSFPVQVVGMGTMLVGLFDATLAGLGYSLDGGVTWKRSAQYIVGAPKHLVAGGGSLLALTASRAYCTLRVDEPNAGEFE